MRNGGPACSSAFPHAFLPSSPVCFVQPTTTLVNPQPNKQLSTTAVMASGPGRALVCPRRPRVPQRVPTAASTTLRGSSTRLPTALPLGFAETWTATQLRSPSVAHSSPPSTPRPLGHIEPTPLPVSSAASRRALSMRAYPLGPQGRYVSRAHHLLHRCGVPNPLRAHLRSSSSQSSQADAPRPLPLSFAAEHRALSM